MVWILTRGEHHLNDGLPALPSLFPGQRREDVALFVSQHEVERLGHVVVLQDRHVVVADGQVRYRVLVEDVGLKTKKKYGNGNKGTQHMSEDR